MAWAAAAGIPNADRPEAYKQADLIQDKLAFHRRHMVEAYDRVGRQDPRWDAQAKLLLEECAKLSAHFEIADMHRFDWIGEKALLALIDELEALGCDDPMVRFWMAAETISRRSVDRPTRYALTRSAHEGLRDSGYSTYRRAMAARLWLGQLYTKHEDYPAAVAAYADACVALLEDPEVDLAEERFMYQLIHDLDDRVAAEDYVEIYERLCAVDTRMTWWRDMLGGDLERELAWDARGGGFARTVTEDGWVGFRHHLARAEVLYISAYNARPAFPEAATKMIGVSMGRGTDQERAWFERATAAQFDHWDAYSAYRWSIRPRWGGSFAQLYTFGLECLETGRFDTTVPYNFEVALENIVDDMSGYDYYRRPGVYENYIRYLDGKLANPDRGWGDGWAESKKVAVGWRAGRLAEAQAELVALGDRFDPEAIRRFDGEPSLAVGEVHLHGTAGAEALVRAREFYRRGREAAAAEVLREAIEALGPDHPGRVYLRHAERLSEIAVLDRAGGWIEMTGQPDFAGWLIHGGQWTIDEQQRWVGHSGKRGYVEGLLMKCRYDLGARFEVRATITFLRKNNSTNAGVFFDVEKIGDRPNHLNVVVRPDADEVQIARRWNNGRLTVENPVGDTVELHVQRWDDHVRVAVDGIDVFVNTKMPTRNRGDSYPLGVGGKAWHPSLSLRFDRLEVRRLAERPFWVPRPEGEAPAMPQLGLAGPMPEPQS